MLEIFGKYAARVVAAYWHEVLIERDVTAVLGDDHGRVWVDLLERESSLNMPSSVLRKSVGTLMSVTLSSKHASR